MALYDTVANVVLDAAIECGLGAVSDVFGSTDPNVVQMRYLLKRLGRKLALRRQWAQLTKEYSFTTTSDSSYNLPADFGAMIHQTGWNRTSDQRMHAASPQEWQYLKATDSGVVFTCIFRPSDSTIQLWPQPPASGETIAFEYLSRYWVATTGSTTGSKDAPTLNTDVLLFDSLLLVGGLKVAFQKAKGFDTTAAEQDFMEEWGLVAAANQASAPILSMNGPRIGERLIDLNNAPSTGFGFDGGGGLF